MSLAGICQHAIGQCSFTVNAGPDLKVCMPGDMITINGKITGNPTEIFWTPATGLSNPKSPVTKATVTGSIEYILTARGLSSTNLIVNGNFEAGRTGFFTDYILGSVPCYGAGYLDCEGTYDVINNPQLGHSAWAPCNDHTTGGGLMMVLNGAAAFQNVWCQNVAVVPDMDYVFTAWITSVHSSSPPVLQFSINGVNIGPNFSSSGVTCLWEKYEVIWNSGSNTSAFICILNENTSTGGNDFAIDDLGFRKICEVKDTMKIEVEEIIINIEDPSIVTCDQPTVRLDAKASSSGTGWSYQWTTADGRIISGANTLDPIVRGPGTYFLTICSPLPNCCLTKSIEVKGKIIPPDLFISVKDTLGCNNISVTVQTRSTVFPLDYVWSGPGGFSSYDPFIVVTEAGKYIVTITDEYNCKTIDSVTVYEKTDNPKISIESNSINCFSDTARLKGNSTIPGSTFEWIGPKNDTQKLDSWNVVDSGLYVLKVISPTGCIKYDSIRIKKDKTIPDLTYSADTITCKKDSATILVTSNKNLISTHWQGSSNFRILDSLSIKTNTGGQYSIRVVSENGCDNTLLINLFADTKKPKLKPISDSIFLTCLVELAELISRTDDPNAIISWTGPNGFLSNRDSVQTDQAGTYKVIGTSRNGCADTTQVQVLVDKTPSTLNSTDDTLTCNNSSLKLKLEILWDTTLISWKGPNSFQSNEKNPLVNNSGLYTVTVTSKNGCSSTKEITISVDTSKPVLQLSNDTLTCKKDSISLNAFKDQIDASILWNGPGGFQSDQLNPFVTIPGNYQLIVTNSNGCKDTAGLIIFQDIGKPDLVANNDTLNCVKRIGNLMAISTRDSLDYLWTGPNGFNSTNKNITVNIPGSYTIRANTPDDCFTILTVELVEDTLKPDLLLIPDTLNCLKTETNLQFQSGAALKQFDWKGPGGFTSNLQNPLISLGGIYTLIVSASNQCTQEQNIRIEQDTISPKVIIQFDSINCNKREVDLIASILPTALTGEWTTPSQQKIKANTIKTKAGGSYNFDVIGKNHCINSALVFIAVDTLAPDLFVKDDTINCITPQVSLNAISNTQGITYEWTGPDAYFSNKALNTISQAGNFQIKITASNGCTQIDNVLITIDTIRPQLVVTGDSLIDCSRLEATILATTNVPDAIIQWRNLNTGEIFSNTSFIKTKQEGNFNIQAINLHNGCTSLRMHQVLKDSLIITDVFIDPIHPICGAVYGSAQVVNVIGGHQNIRFAIDQKTNYTSNPTFNTLSSGLHTIYVIDDKLCEFKKEFEIIDIPYIETNLIPEIILQLGDSSRLDLNIFPDRNLIRSIEWTPGQFLSCTDCEDPIARPLVTTEYEVTVIDTNGCLSKQRIRIKVETPKVWVPNVFSPNGDNINDLVWVHGSKEDVTRINVLQIFDRWGNRVFENTNFEPNDQSKGWNGMFNHQKCNPGVYVYWAEVELIDGQKWIIKGDITLIR